MPHLDRLATETLAAGIRFPVEKTQRSVDGQLPDPFADMGGMMRNRAPVADCILRLTRATATEIADG